MMETLLQDIRYGFRMLFKSPGFTAVAALSLALGIGANTTIFTLINAIFLSPIPVHDAPGLVTLYTTDARVKDDEGGGDSVLMPMSRPNFEDFRDHNSVFAGLVAVSGLPLNMLHGGTPEQIGGEIVSGSYFSLLGVTPTLGRAFLPEEDKTPGAHPVVVLSHAFWTKRFGGDQGIVGSSLTLNGLPFTVIGVAPKGFLGTNLLASPNLWVPMMMHKEVLAGFAAENFDDRRALIFNVFGRLKPGATLGQAQAEFRTIAANLEKEYPQPNQGRSVTLMPLAQTTIFPALRRTFTAAGRLLMTIVGLVLLIACANVANLLLARSTARRKEIAIRLSLGASRARLVRQLLTESMLLALLGGVLGLLIAVWGRDLLLAFRPPQFFPDGLTLDLDGRVLGFTLAISLITGALFGIAPALQASRPDLVIELKERTGSQAAHRGGRFSLRGVLVVTQVALSLISLVGAGLFLRSMQNTQRIDPGFQAKSLLNVGFDLGAQGFDMVRARAYHDRLLETVRTLPGVRAASLSANLPIGGGTGRTIFPEGQAPNTGAVGQFATTNSVGPGFFATLGIPI
ncbi:MAG TPA: ADOP family duplicated permease, partial [Candidatus Polarisedimenticolia bacterium]